ncbi:hypothetical protein AWB67_07596 [Caballeronia terrestris]|uniref:Uncharacterized protein n=1 Tax=Caballeronia terrestris TaxID=1226301 RepID=A0A158L4Z2_9BURK|nr:hypothetical protein [Caballeronia terrestris]SAL88436.1 hypothetical protein AWB67_07596 [Caballeronia terrestris]
MTYAIYAILTGMAIIFSVSFYWYRQAFGAQRRPGGSGRIM